MAAPTTRSSESAASLDVPLPYRVLSKEYMAQQLPNLQERAPQLAKVPLEFQTNAPENLPMPSLFPGEVIRMKQHRVVCTNCFEEPAVGVVYLTNFRAIFNGSPVSDPDMFDIIHEMQNYSTSSRKGDTISVQTHSSSNSRTLGWPRKKHSLPAATPRQSRFYVGNALADPEGGEGDDEREDVEEDTKQQPTLSSKLFQRLNTIRRSTGAGIKNAFGDISADIVKLKQMRVNSPTDNNLTIPSHLDNPDSAALSSSVPNQPHPFLDTPLQDHKPVTLPRNMPHHQVDLETMPLGQSYQTADSGIVDLPPDATPPNDLIDTPPNELSTIISQNVFTNIPTVCETDEIDFERAPIDFPLSDRRREHPQFRRPTSFLALDSDSDSDTVSDRHFGNITEDDEMTSPEVMSPPALPPHVQHIYENVTLKNRVEATPSVSSIDELSVTESKLEKETPPVKPPRRKKRTKTEEQRSPDSPAAVTTTQTDLACGGAADTTDSANWTRSHSDGLSRKGSEQRRPPPPPPSRPLSGSTPVSPITRTSSDPDILSSALPIPSASLPSQSTPPLVQEAVANDRSSSLIVNRSSSNSYYRRLTISSPRDPPYSFDWAERSTSKGSHDASSLPHNFSTSLPYYQYSYSVSIPLATIHSIKPVSPTVLEKSGLRVPDGILILGKNFFSLKLHLHSNNTYDALKLKDLLEGVMSEMKPVFKSFAFHYRAAIKLPNPHILDSRKLPNFFHFDTEINRIGILNSKIKNSHLWRVTTITKTNPELCPSYPEKLVVLLCTPDVDLLRGGNIYEEGRFPTACWMNQANHSVLLRAAATTSERGLQSSKLPVDEAILQAVRGCNANSKLYVFTEKSDTPGFQDPNKLTKEAARSYYYHNCNFVYSVNPPTYKSVRHSFNKLQAMLQSNVSDYEYLVTLDGTRWLSRVGELLATTYKVVEALTVESAHVLVCYEKGWDRTTQIVSLAQLLCDPFYRTMDGFQILIQKEWLWFGHPFQARHNRQNSKVKEDGPIFMQWIDCVWQMTRQCPFAFEFNENLLIALVEHAYSKQFGTFMTNSERERQQCFMIPDHYHQSVHKNTISFWTWVAMVNASNNIFYNQYYDPTFYTGTIYPRYYQACLEIWRAHYDRQRLRQDIQDGNTVNSKLHMELQQLLRLFKERQPSLPALALNLGLDISSMSPLLPALSNNEVPIGPNPVSSSSVQTVPAKVKSNRHYTSVGDFLSAEGYDPSICHNVVLSTGTCQGYLTKEGGFMKNWKRRWFVLDYTTQYLAYFESEEHFIRKESPKGVISLEDIKKVSLSTRRTHLMSNLFQVKTPLRTYNIKAPSIVTMEIWMACLKLPPHALSLPPS